MFTASLPAIPEPFLWETLRETKPLGSRSAEDRLLEEDLNPTSRGKPTTPVNDAGFVLSWRPLAVQVPVAGRSLPSSSVGTIPMRLDG